MRFTWTAFACATCAILTLTPAYADQHGNSSSAPGHAQAGHAQAGPKAATTRPTPTHTLPPNPIATKIAAKPQLNGKVTALCREG